MSSNAEQSALSFASVLLALGSTNNNNNNHYPKNNGDDDHSITGTSEVSEASTTMSTSDIKPHHMSSSLLRVPRVSQSTVMSMFHGHTSIFASSSSSSSSQASLMGTTNTAITTVDTTDNSRNMTSSSSAGGLGMGGDTVDGDMKQPNRRRSSGSSSGSSSHDRRPKNHHHHHDRRRGGGITTNSSHGLITSNHLFPLAQPCGIRSVSTSHTAGDQGSMVIFQGSGLPCNTQLAKTELQLLSALGRRTHNDESPDSTNHNNHNHNNNNNNNNNHSVMQYQNHFRHNSYSMQSHQEERTGGGGDGRPRNDIEMETEEDEEEEEEDKEQSLKASAAAAAAAAAVNRGKYKCSRCGAVKSNHHCPVMEQFTIADATQYEPMVLTASEFNSTYVGKISSSSSSSILDVGTTTAAGAGMSATGVSIDLSGLSVANCLRMLPVRPNYVPVVPSHALKKPMRYHHSDPTNNNNNNNNNNTTTAVGMETSTHAAASGSTTANSQSNQGKAATDAGGAHRQRPPGGLQFHAPRMLSPDEYVVDDTGRNSLTDMMHLHPGVLYLPIPTSYILEGGGLQLAAMSLMTGEPVGVFSLTSSLVAGGGSDGTAAATGASSSSASFAGHGMELSTGTNNKQEHRNKQQTLQHHSPKYQHQVVFQPVSTYSSPTVSTSRYPTAAVALPHTPSAPPTMTASGSVVNHSTSTGTGMQ